ncbi:hypothetical protein [Pseudomonas asiatica]|uniref:Uncharacterized protein n=1 Tax=Pseudomonas asiatica TaxID=2219225 RepID=A0A9X4D2X8_9PSED|nr:hypothetical protein [Pseudomonas asiatica]MDD2108858.1 hypothetical protein [Pseudomonas asiatica]
MKLDFVYGVGCTLLFAVGVLISPVLIKGDSSAFFNAIGSIANVATAVVAFAALRAWKPQFRQAKLSSALDELAVAADELKVIKKHLPDMYNYYRSKFGKDDRGLLAEHEGKFLESGSQWHEAYARYSQALKTVRIYLSGCQEAERLDSLEDIMRIYLIENVGFLNVVDSNSPGSAEVGLLLGEMNVKLRGALKDINEAILELRESAASFKLR